MIVAGVVLITLGVGWQVLAPGLGLWGASFIAAAGGALLADGLQSR